MRKTLVLFLLVLVLGVSADTNKTENPYLGINERNAFELVDSIPIPTLPPATNILSPNVFLTGITRLNSVRKVHLVLKRGGEPNKYVSLAVDQKQYNIKLNKILNDSAKITNNGVPTLLSFEKNGLPTTITKVATKQTERSRYPRGRSSKDEKDGKK